MTYKKHVPFCTYLVVRIVIGVCLAITLFALGFFVCAAPPTTHALSSATSEFESSPYTHDELISLARETRALTVDFHPEGWDAAQDRMCEDIVAAAQVSADPESPKNGRWSQISWNVNLSEIDTSDGEACRQAVSRMASISDQYALDADAFSHLRDCNNVICAAYLILLVIAIVAIVGLVQLYHSDTKKFCSTITVSSWAILAFMAVCAIACVISFDDFFAIFHQIFFPQGNWTFSARSLLISMLPTDFWMGMGITWFVATVIACIVMLVVAHRSRRHA